jgi:hypothetical protein
MRISIKRYGTCFVQDGRRYTQIKYTYFVQDGRRYTQIDYITAASLISRGEATLDK